MRLWSLHPRYLDAPGLVALWRETLLAKAVLRGETQGYQHHPQLQRFRLHPEPLSAIDTYLATIHAESVHRGYRFDATKTGSLRTRVCLPVTTGQLRFEWEHLLDKLSGRSPVLYRQWAESIAADNFPDPHLLFQPVAGPIESWERSGLISTR